MTYFKEAKKKAMERPPPKKRKLKTRNMAKKRVDPQKKLLITAIKKTINKNSVLPILEDVLLTGDHAIVSDLEVSVVIPYKTDITVAVPSGKFIDCLEMMESPKIEPVYAEAVEPSFEVEGVMYLGDETEIEIAWTKLNVDDQVEWEDYVKSHCTAVPADYEFKFVTKKTFGVNFIEGKRLVKVTGEDPDNFPITPLIDKDYPEIGSFNEDDMVKLSNAIQFISTDDLRPAMTGIYLGEDEFSKTSKIVATDAHRMYFDDLSGVISRSFILPGKAAKILLALGGEWKLSAKEEYKKKDDKIVLVQPTKIEMAVPEHFTIDGVHYRGSLQNAESWYKEFEDLPTDQPISDDYKDGFKESIKHKYRNEIIEDIEEKEEVEVPDLDKKPEPILLDLTKVCFTREDGVKVIARSIDARFPNYNVVIPQGEGNTVVTVNPDEMLLELKNAMKFANRTTNMVVLGANVKLSISSQDIDFGEEYSNEFEEFEIKHNEGEGFNIGFNAKFLSEVITKEKDNPIEMKLWSPIKATIINDHYLIMPLMLNNN